MANGLPQPPDPTKILGAGVEAVQDVANLGIDGLNAGINALNVGMSKGTSVLGLPSAPAAIPPLPRAPSLAAGLPALPAGLPGLPPLPGMEQKRENRVEKEAVPPGVAGYGERTGVYCARAAGAGKMGYGEE